MGLNIGFLLMMKLCTWKKFEQSFQQREKMKIPPYLKPGDTIGLICPAGAMPIEKAQTAINVLQEWGFKIITGTSVGSSHYYFSGTDDDRLADLQSMMDDTSVKAILCARGGYGTGRIVDRLHFKKFKKHPKWIIGFSDITVLHCHLLSRYKIASLHAPMAAAFNDDQYTNPYVQSLHEALIGKKTRILSASHPFNRYGRVEGILAGGNLSLLTHLIGTSSDVNMDGKILFIEDTGEYLYNVDRMLYQLKRNGKFEKLAGLIVGGFTDMKDTNTPFGKSIEEIINEVIKDYNFPVCFSFPISHEKENFAVKIGLKYKLSIKKNTISLQEL